LFALSASFEAKADAKIILLNDTLQILEQLFKKFFSSNIPKNQHFNQHSVSLAKRVQK